MKITNNFKIEFEMDGFEPKFTVWRRIRHNYTSTVTYGLFSFYYKLKLKLYNHGVKSYFKRMNYPILFCEGCGEGVSEWLILDPNMNGKKLNVCSNCVDFYNILGYKKRLETIWNTEEEVNLFK